MPSLVTFYGDERRRWPFQLSTDRTQFPGSGEFERRVAEARVGDIVDCSVKQRSDRNARVHISKEHHNSLYDIWLKVKVKEGKGKGTLCSLTAIDFYEKSTDMPKAVTDIVTAQKTFLLEKYSIRAERARTSFLKKDVQGYEENATLVFDLFFGSNERGEFAVVQYDNNQNKVLREEYRIVTAFTPKVVFNLSFIAIDSLRRKHEKLTLLSFIRLQVKKKNLLSRCLLQQLSRNPGCEQTLENFRTNWKSGRTFYIVSVGAGSCRDGLLAFRRLRIAFGERLRLKVLFIDIRFEPKPGTNTYYYNLKTLKPDSIACNALTNCYEEMVEEERKHGESVFEFYKLSYLHSNAHALYKIRLRTLLFMGSPDCAPFSLSNFGATQEMVRDGTIGVYYVFSLLFACRPAVWVLESTGSQNPRLLMHQPLMKPLEHMREEYTHCMFESPPIKLDSNGTHVLWLFKPTHVWSSSPLHLRKCTKKEPCLCFQMFHKHKPVESLTSREEKAMWPLGFIEAICNAVKELLKERDCH